MLTEYLRVISDLTPIFYLYTGDKSKGPYSLKDLKGHYSNLKHLEVCKNWIWRNEC